MNTAYEPASKRKKRIVLGFLLGIVPAGLLFFKLFDNHYTTLPYYGNHEVNAPGDTTYFQVPPFSFTRLATSMTAIPLPTAPWRTRSWLWTSSSRPARASAR